MRFFDGKTESLSTIKLIMRKPYRSRTIGTGEIDSGVLNLIAARRGRGQGAL